MAGLISRKSCARVWPLAFGLLAGCGQSEAPDDGPTPAPPVVRVVPADQALAGAEIRKLDLATLNRAEIVEVIGDRPQCIFRYTSSGKPVLAAALGPVGGPAAGVVKLNGNLVPLQPDPGATIPKHGGFTLLANPLRIQVQRANSNPAGLPQPGGGQVEADMVFQVGEALTVGYGGYLECRKQAPGPVHRP